MHSLVAYLSRYGKVNVIKVVHVSRGFFKNDEKSPFLLATQGVVVTKINFFKNRRKKIKSKNPKDCGFVTLA